MKKVFYICAILLTLATSGSIVTAQTSGWDDKGEYKEQKLRIPNLQAIAFSPDSSLFYTLHDNRVVYYWNTETGKLIDSLLIAYKNTNCFFSKDGNSIIITFETVKQRYLIKSRVAIVDLSIKKEISNAQINLPGNIPSYVPLKEPVFWSMFSQKNIRFTYVDYNSSNHQCYCGFSYDHEYRTIAITAESSNEEGFGGLAVFDVKSDTLLPIKKVSFFPIRDFKIVDSNFYYIFEKYTSNTSRIGKVSNSWGTTHEWYVYKYDNSKDKALEITKKGYYYHYKWDEIHGVDTLRQGTNIPYSNLIPNVSHNQILLKSDTLYFVINLKSMQIIDTLFLPKNAICEQILNTKDKLAYLKDSIVFFLDLSDKDKIGFISSPMQPNNIVFLSDGRDFILTNVDGRILKFENFIAQNKIISGWKIKSKLKEQILKIDHLKSIISSPDSKTLYSLHDNRTVWYWDLKSGVRFDSLNIDSGSVAVFSKDGKTLCVYKKMPDNEKNYAITTITIYDLSSKAIISNSEVDFPGRINYDVPIMHNPKVSNRRYNTLDYDYATGKLTCGIAFQYDFEAGTKINNRSSYTLGGAATFLVYPNSLVKDIQISSVMPFSVINAGVYSFTTLLSSIYEKSNWDATDSSYTECKFILRKTGLAAGDHYDLIRNIYKKSDRYTNGTHEINEITGAFKPLTNLFYVARKSLLAVREENSYYIFDSNKDLLIDSLSLIPGATLETLNRDSTGLYYAVGNAVYLQNINSKKILDTLLCDFTPCAITLTEDGIVVGGEKGEIVLFKEKPKSIFDDANYPALSINPNPASDELFLTFESDLNGSIIEIYTAAGLKVLEAPYSERIDISSLPAGVYFLRVGGKIGKFVKDNN